MKQYEFTEITDVVIRSENECRIGDRIVGVNEPIIRFDSIQVAQLKELKQRSAATGGNCNQTFVYWDDTTKIYFSFSEGLASWDSLTILSNSNVSPTNQSQIVHYNQEISEFNTVSQQDTLILKYSNPTNIYLYNGIQRITDYILTNENTIIVNAHYTTPYVIYYDFIYTNMASNLNIGKRMLNGFLSITGRVRVRDDENGYERTLLIEIPKVLLMSDISMTLGTNVSNPMYAFSVEGYPVGDRGNRSVCTLTLLEDDIDSDI